MLLKKQCKNLRGARMYIDAYATYVHMKTTTDWLKVYAEKMVSYG